METKNNKIILGLILLLIGGSLMLRNLNLLPDIPFFHMFFTWKMLLVLLGLTIIVAASNKITGIVLLLIGGLFMLSDLDLLPALSFWKVVLPIILIVVGVSIIFSKTLHPGGWRRTHHKGNVDELDEVAILGGGKKIVSAPDFKGGKITAIFGGSELDLTSCEIVDGPVIIDLVAIFGGVSLFVPDDWTIKTDVVAILGGFSDSRKPSRLLVKDESKVLIIKGFVLLGGGEIK